MFWVTVALTGVTTVLAVFTGYLWNATRHLVNTSERTTKKQLERAYIYGGGPYGKPREAIALAAKEHGFPKASMYADPRRMTIHNYGKTIGYVTKVEWGLCDPSRFPPELTVSQAIDSGKIIPCIVKYPGVFPPSGTEVMLYRHVEFNRQDNLGKVFFGRIWYKDIWDEVHHSAFALLLNYNFSDPYGQSYSEDKS